MEGIPQEYPEKIIEANSEQEAYYKYHKFNGIEFGTFEEFQKQPEAVQKWATSLKLINE